MYVYYTYTYIYIYIYMAQGASNLSRAIARSELATTQGLQPLTLNEQFPDHPNP